MASKKLTDEELHQQLAALTKELDLRRKAEMLKEEARELDSKHTLVSAVSSNHKLLGALVGEHTPGRYGSTCSDSRPERGVEFSTMNDKDWRCQRCLLLNMISRSYNFDEFEFMFEVRYLGPVE